MLAVVIPTFNERGNLQELVKRISTALNHSSVATYEIIIVDDNSPDKTWEKAQELSETFPVNAIRRMDNKGLATAVLRGVKEAEYDTIVVMDADLQHPPEKIPELISAVEEGNDIAIGSRFVEEGSTGEFSWVRKAISQGANFLARTLFRETREIEDIQSGFFAFKKQVTENLDLNPKGYKILLEILVRGDYNKVKEVGYKFDTRKAGESKLGMDTIFDYLNHLFQLSVKQKEVVRFVQFCAVGATGAVVNLSVLYILTTLGLYYLLSGAIAIEVSLLSNFFINKAWTFQDRGITGIKPTIKALYRDHIVRFGGLAIKLFFLWFLTDIFGLFYIVSQVIGIGVATLWNFGGNKWWTWEV